MNKNDENFEIKAIIYVAKDMVIFPKTIYLLLPIIIFCSLFLVPKNYTEFTFFAKNMNGAYHNRWLYDMMAIYHFILFLIVFIKVSFFEMSINTKVVIRKNIKQRLSLGYGNTPYYARPLLTGFIFLFLAILIAYITSYTMYPPYRNGGMTNDNHFVNFFYHIVFRAVPIIFFIQGFVYQLEVKNHVL